MNISTSTNFQNNTFTVDEIDIDTKRPQVNNFDFSVKQIKLKETRINQIEIQNSNTQKASWKTPNSVNSNIPLRIKQRVLTPYRQDISKFEKRDFFNLNLSTIVSSGEPRMIPDIIITEFLDENKENLNSMSQNEVKKEINKINKKSDTPKCVKIKPAENIKCSDKCECCNKSVMKIGENRIFVSNSVQANLAVDEFEGKGKTTEKNVESINYLETNNHANCASQEEGAVDSYDNDYYFMNELLSKEKQPDFADDDETLKSVEKPKINEYFYFYCSAERYLEINRKRLIKTEPMIIDGEIKNALVLLAVGPETSDIKILNELFEKNTPIDLKRIECYIMIRRDNIEKHNVHLIQVNQNKFLFKRSIILQGTFPKNCMKVKAK